MSDVWTELQLCVTATGHQYGTLVQLAVFRLHHPGHVIVFVPCQHEIPTACNSKHKTDAEFGVAGIKSFLIKQAPCFLFQGKAEKMIWLCSSCHVPLTKVSEYLYSEQPA